MAARFPKSALKGRKGVGDYNNVPGTFYGPDPAETSGRGRGARRAHPNGGEARPMPDIPGKMPRSKSAPVEQSTPLPVTHPKMPQNMSGRRQNEPHIR